MWIFVQNSLTLSEIYILALLHMNQIVEKQTLLCISGLVRA